MAKEKPNVRLAKGAQPAAVDGDVNAPELGNKPIRLPDKATQFKGWYEERADILRRLYPDKYLRFDS